MSNKTKKIGMWSLKALAVGLFVFLALYNIQLVTGNYTSEINLADVKTLASVFVASAESGNCECAGGPGSTECSCNIWQISCSVSCSSGYYACCTYDGCHCKKS